MILVILSTSINQMNKNNNQTSEWKNELLLVNKQYIEEIKNDNVESQSMLELLTNQININNYYINKNINPNIVNVWNYIDDSSIFFIILIIFMLIMSSSIISNEVNNKSIDLLLTSQYSKNQIILSKYITLIVVSLIFTSFTFIVCLISGMIFLGVDGTSFNVISTMSGIKTISILESIAFKYLSYFITLLNSVTFAFAISSIFNSSNIAIIISLIAQFLGSGITNIFNNYSWVKYTYFVNLDISSFLGCYNSIINGLTLSQSIIKDMSYIIIFLLIAIIIFKNKKLESKIL